MLANLLNRVDNVLRQDLDEKVVVVAPYEPLASNDEKIHAAIAASKKAMGDKYVFAKPVRRIDGRVYSPGQEAA